MNEVENQEFVERMDAAYACFQDVFSDIYPTLVRGLQVRFGLPETLATTVVGRGLVTLGALNVAYGLGNDMRNPVVSAQCGRLSIEVLDYAVARSRALYQENANV